MPAFSYTFTTTTMSTETCGCPDATVDASNFDRTGDSFSFSQSIRGGTRDAAGDPTWPFSLQQWGQGNGSVGGLDFSFTLDSKSGQFTYGGSAALAERSTLPDGAVMYRFEGTFRPINSQPVPGLPVRGSVSTTLSVWRDGTIFAGTFALTDAPA
jgi:hypothetical protein